MTETTKIGFTDSELNCPSCGKNDMLFKIIEKEVSEIFMVRVNTKVLSEKIFCEWCNISLQLNELVNKESKFTVEHDSEKITLSKKTVVSGDKVVVTTTIIRDDSEYVPKYISNETLYFDMLFMLLDFIETHQSNINLESSKVYQLASSRTTLDLEEFSDDFENKILAKFETCYKELRETDLQYLFKNSLSVLKGQMTIDDDVYDLYCKMFSIQGIGELKHQSYFLSMLV